MFKLTTMTIERQGDVTFPVRGGNHCGPRDRVSNGSMTARYTYKVVCAPSLDAHGFLFDQTALDAFVRRVTDREPYESCEHMARDLAIKFLAHLAREVPTCLVERITVTLSPSPYAAALSVEYVRDDG